MTTDRQSKSDRRSAALAAIALLSELYPRCFFVLERRRLPLKLGIRADLVRAAAASGAIKPHELKLALSFYCANAGYLRAQRRGAARIDLDGHPAGAVTASEAGHAAETLATRLLRGARRQSSALSAPKPATITTTTPTRLGLAELKTAWRARNRSGKPHSDKGSAR